MAIPQTEIVATVEGKVISRRLVSPGEYLLGADEDCEICLPFGSVSPRHARLTVHESGLELEDLRSGAGTLVSGRPITERMRLWPGQAIQLGEAKITTRRLKEGNPSESLLPWTAELRRQLPEELRHEGRYAVHDVVAESGMGAILDVRDQTIRRTVAMKVMLDPRFSDDMMRFIAEAQVTGQLEHPNIVPIYELGVDEHEQPFYTMKFVRGLTLKQVLESIAAGEEAVLKKYSLAALLTVFQKVCDAIAFAHSRGVIHRDLKPENVMLGDFGEVLVMDWGLAKTGSASGAAPCPTSIRAHSGALGATLAGTVIGTPNFMAPEQAGGCVEEIGACTDIFALGGLLYAILTLQAPFTGANVEEVLAKVVRGGLSAPENLGTPAGKHLPAGRVPDALSAVAMKALAHRAEERYPTVPALQKDIAAYQGGFATTAERAGFFRQVGLLVRRNKREFSIVACAGVLLAVLAIWSFAKVSAGERLAELHRSMAVAERDRAETTLAQLKDTAPTFFQQAGALVENRDFATALRMIDYAVSLAPERAAYAVRRGMILQSLKRFHEAKDSFSTAIRLEPGVASAAANLELCAQLAAAMGANGELSDAGSQQFYEALLVQGRHSEAAAVSTPLVREGPAARKAHVYWQKKIAAAGVNPSCLKLYDGYRFGADLKGRQVTDIRFLKDVPLVKLDIDWTNVSDLSPLRGMPLKELNLNGTPAQDLTPLRGMKLQVLLAEQTRVTDLSPLRGMPLRCLVVNATRVTHLSALQGMPLERVEVTRTEVNDLSPLRGAPLVTLMANHCPLANLSPLVGMPLRALDIAAVKVASLEPLRQLPLAEVDLSSLPLENLEIFRGKPLLRLFIPHTNISSLEPLRGMPLKYLDLHNCRKLTDLSPLVDCPGLIELILPPGAEDLTPLRSLKQLQRLSYTADAQAQTKPRQTVEEFWREHASER